MQGVNRVLADANVLYSRTLRDWLFLLKLETATGMYSICSTEDIIAEVLYALRRKNPTLDGQNTFNIRKLLVSSIDELISEFDGSVPNPYNDVNDSHIHSVAVCSGLEIVLTSDTGLLSLADSAREDLPYELMHPDDFFVLIDDSAPHVVKSVTSKQLNFWTERHSGSDKNRRSHLVEALKQAGCPNFALRVQGHLRSLAGAPGQ